MDIPEALAQVAQGGSQAVVASCLARAQAMSRLNCFSKLFATQALEAAAASDAGTGAGPLQGVPFAVKDIYAMAGHWPLGGSRFDGLVAGQAPAQLPGLLQAAGAIAIGTTHLDELCYGMTGLNPHHGPVLNPLDETCITGGSSSGSAAAVAAGIVPFALGSDTGGSIRVPAALCGVVGFKPSHGMFDTQNMLPLSPTQDCVGWLTRSVDDARQLFDVCRPATAGHRHPCSSEVEGLRIGVLEHPFLTPQEPSIQADLQALRQRLQACGAQVLALDGSFLARCDEAASAITGFEAARFHRDRLAATPHLFSPATQARLRRGQSVSDTSYAEAIAWRQACLRCPPWAASGCDFLLAPTVLGHAPRIDALLHQPELGLAYTLKALQSTRAFSFLGGPVIAFPLAGKSRFPSSVQLVGRVLDDQRVLAIARSLQRVFASVLQRQNCAR
ncbi:MAG: hypothetical protein DI587_37625 [Variovorax paradoxus]|nr:MAG: hypothetical protein DI583_37625 [Variovorax paradoxus]PZQ00045.1 MAG: hypothetical protein DI587_37625 [Variovorax paradoxus]